MKEQRRVPRLRRLKIVSSYKAVINKSKVILRRNISPITDGVCVPENVAIEKSGVPAY